ncbi:hypothetical protein AB0L47_24745 [Streptomyces bobili]|uniref:hypothetical protein n=1 Tax=Streptomyces bobili TaxID=67280 RepID=UPI00342F4DF2
MTISVATAAEPKRTTRLLLTSREHFQGVCLVVVLETHRQVLSAVTYAATSATDFLDWYERWLNHVSTGRDNQALELTSPRLRAHPNRHLMCRSEGGDALGRRHGH